MRSPNGIPHSPAQKSGLYISGDFRETGSFIPSVALTPNANRRWLKKTTASPPITPAAKQIATLCIRVNPLPIMFDRHSGILAAAARGQVLHCHTGAEEKEVRPRCRLA